MRIGTHDALRYEVIASPARIAEVIGEVTAPESVIGFSFGESTDAQFVGSVESDGSFRLRRVRPFGPVPRVLALRGDIRPEGTGSVVVARYAFVTAVRAARAAWLAFFIVGSAIVLPSSVEHPGLLWIVVVMAFLVAMMLVPFMWLAHYDRAQLRAAFEAALRRAGPYLAMQY